MKPNVPKKQVPKPAGRNGKEFSSLEQVMGHFFPVKARKRAPLKGKELGTELAEEVFEELLNAELQP